MKIPDVVTRCVTFVGYQMADGGFRFAGSSFYICHSSSRIYAVTARHVIDSIVSKGLEKVFLRINLKDGNSGWFESKKQDWFMHPSDSSIDVAIHETGLLNTFDHVVIPHARGITDHIMKKNEIGLGEEVFITGLFKHHYGSRKNIPIVRVGNLACWNEEKILTESFGALDAYLIEARSIGGLSGSPVFLNLGTSRIVKEKFVHVTKPIIFLLGMMHGHYDVRPSGIERSEEEATTTLSTPVINTGIGIVVPFHCINNVICEYENHH